MIDRIPFGRTGHDSSRTIFGAAALGFMGQERADRTLELFSERGLNHIDTAASYGDSELRLAPFLRRHRGEVFLATKTRERDAAGARASLERSLERLGVASVDLIQLHNLVQEDEWQVALGPGGALEGLRAARDAGLVRFLGVTGHGTVAPAMHLRSLERFDFDSVLAPYNWSLLQDARYADEFDALAERCRRDGVALQTIKAVSRRRWRDGDPDRRFSWYRPLEDPEAIARAVGFTLARPGLFLNTTSDARLLPAILDAAEAGAGPVSEAALQADAERYGIEPLFVRGVAEDVVL